MAKGLGHAVLSFRTSGRSLSGPGLNGYGGIEN